MEQREQSRRDQFPLPMYTIEWSVARLIDSLDQTTIATCEGYTNPVEPVWRFLGPPFDGSFADQKADRARAAEEE